MSLIKIPDGARAPIYFESLEILAVRDAMENRTWIFLRGDAEAWKVECPINQVISLIPERG